ncbi:hypothetical protein PENSPDRAFT_493014 [Peniophora sp. CONT]|nr:hypothetical protein PENSPDRAFT_493014 [Peniophora sp. CONT]
MADPWHDLARIRLVVPSTLGTNRNQDTRYLDAEIKSLEAVLSQARHLRNARNFFVSLPEELLLDIMLLHRDIAPANSRSLPARNKRCWHCDSSQLWTSIAGVCRRFRDVARAPLLYTSMSDNNLPPELMERILARSRIQGTPLTLELGDCAYMGHTNSAIGLLKHIMAYHASRVRTLNLYDHHRREIFAEGKVVQQVLWPILGSSSSLKSLSIHNYVKPQNLAIQSSGGPVIEPLDASGRPFRNWKPPPSLESLELTITPFAWECPIYNNLVNLTLRRVRVVPLVLVGLLSRMGRLEHLVLDKVDARDDSHDVHFFAERARAWDPPPSLKTLYVGTYANSMADNLLPFMRPSTSISYTFDTLATRSREVEHTMTFLLASHFSKPNGDENCVMSLPPVFSVQFSLTVVRRQLSSGDNNIVHTEISFDRKMDQFGAPGLVLKHAYSTEELDGDGRQYPPSDWLLGNLCKGKLPGSFPCFDSVSELSLDHCDFSYKPAEWAGVFKLFPSLTTLRVSEDTLANILPGTGMMQNRSPVLPTIQTLHVLPSQQYGFKSSRRTVDTLLDWLLGRKLRGHPLKDVRVPSALAAEMAAGYTGMKWKALLEKSS